MTDLFGVPKMSREEKELIGQIKKVHGDIPKGISRILGLMTHPDVIDWTEDWLESVIFENGVGKWRIES